LLNESLQVPQRVDLMALLDLQEQFRISEQLLHFMMTLPKFLTQLSKLQQWRTKLTSFKKGNMQWADKIIYKIAAELFLAQEVRFATTNLKQKISHQM
jgi:hypothetical protein